MIQYALKDTVTGLYYIHPAKYWNMQGEMVKLGPIDKVRLLRQKGTATKSFNGRVAEYKSVKFYGIECMLKSEAFVRDRRNLKNCGIEIVEVEVSFNVK